MAVSKEDIRNLVRLFEQSDWQEMRLEVDGLKLNVSKRGPMSSSAQPMPLAVAAPSVAVLPLSNAHAAATPAATAAGFVAGPGQVVIKAPNLGVFWRQPKPGEPMYVQEGQQIDADTTVCLIEVMKLFTPVKAGVSGRLVRCLAVDGDMVEHDTPLFVVEP